MRPGDLLATRVRLNIFTHDTPWKRVVDQGIIEATGASAVLHKYESNVPLGYYAVVPEGVALMYVAKSDINFVHTSQPRTPVHFLFYNGLSCVMIASDSLIERSFRVISNS